MNNKLWGGIVVTVLVVIAIVVAHRSLPVVAPATDISGSSIVVPTISDTPQGKLPAGSTPPGDSQRLIGTWVWQRTVVRDAPIITPKKVGAFTMTLDTSGHVGGSTDCNDYGGDYRIGSDGVISMSQFIGTLMYCEDSQEHVFTGQLLKANGYSFNSEGYLLINYNNDAGSMIFSRK